MAPISTPQTPFGRVLTAMITPFTADGALDVDGAQQLAVHLVDAGNDGPVLNGTTREAPTTSDAGKSPRGRGHPRHTPQPGARPPGGRGGGARPAGGDAVLQQAAPGGALPALHGHR